MTRLLPLVLLLFAGCVCPRGVNRPFALRADSFAYANELRWQYEFTEAGVITREAKPAPDYSLRCFPMVRAAREFFYHAVFRPDLAKVGDDDYRKLIGRVVGRNSRCAAETAERIEIPGFANLHEFSAEQAGLLKSQCGGAALSFLQRGNWRMVFPLTASSRRQTAERFVEELRAGRLPIAHVYQFPNTALNHAVLVYSAEETPAAITFAAYDPNDPSRPALLTFDREARAFQFERNRYFGGGQVRVYEVYRGLVY